jgi:hypothetical protein
MKQFKKVITNILALITLLLIGSIIAILILPTIL